MNKMLLMTYNVHGFVCKNKKCAPYISLKVVSKVNPDICALQECRFTEMDSPAEYISRITGLHATFGYTMRVQDADYGNILLTRRKPEYVKLHNISYRKREPRGVIEAGVLTDIGEVTVFASHFGLRRKERSYQAQKVADIASDTSGMKIFMGDTNEWVNTKATRALSSVFDKLIYKKTFPASYPMFSLDGMALSGLDGEAQVLRNKLTLLASDHLPVTAEVYKTD